MSLGRNFGRSTYIPAYNLGFTHGISGGLMPGYVASRLRVLFLQTFLCCAQCLSHVLGLRGTS